MPKIRLFASVRVAAGTGSDSIDGTTVGEVLAAANERFGDDFAEVAKICGVWVNGEPAGPDDPVVDSDEVALLPPVSGG
ncbi:MAG: MoaD/ThiS family protein [Acidimicrobiales bacterium]